MEDKIRLFKEKTINFALSYINENGEYANVRELKDITTIVDTIEKSLKPSNDTTTVNFNTMFTKLATKFETEISNVSTTPTTNSLTAKDKYGK